LFKEKIIHDKKNWVYNCKSINALEIPQNEEYKEKTTQITNGLFFNLIISEIYLTTEQSDLGNYFLRNSPKIIFNNNSLNNFPKGGNINFFININKDLVNSYLFSSMFYSNYPHLKYPKFYQILYKISPKENKKFEKSIFISDNPEQEPLLQIVKIDNIIKDFNSTDLIFPNFFINVDINTEIIVILQNKSYTYSLILRDLIKKLKIFQAKFLNKILLNFEDLKILHPDYNKFLKSEIIHHIDLENILELRVFAVNEDDINTIGINNDFEDEYYNLSYNSGRLIIKSKYEQKNDNINPIYFPKFDISKLGYFSYGIYFKIFDSSTVSPSPIFYDIQENLFNKLSSSIVYNGYQIHNEEEDLIMNNNIITNLNLEHLHSTCFWFLLDLDSEKFSLRFSYDLKIRGFISSINEAFLGYTLKIEHKLYYTDDNFYLESYYIYEDKINLIQKFILSNIKFSDLNIWNFICVYLTPNANANSKNISADTELIYFDIFLNNKHNRIIIKPFEIAYYLANKNTNEFYLSLTFQGIEITNQTIYATKRKFNISDYRILLHNNKEILNFDVKNFRNFSKEEILQIFQGDKYLKFNYDETNNYLRTGLFNLPIPFKTKQYIELKNPYAYQEKLTFFLLHINKESLNFTSVFEDGFPKFEYFEDFLLLDIAFNFEFIIKSYKNMIYKYNELDIIPEFDTKEDYLTLEIFYNPDSDLTISDFNKENSKADIKQFLNIYSIRNIYKYKFPFPSKPLPLIIKLTLNIYKYLDPKNPTIIPINISSDLSIYEKEIYIFTFYPLSISKSPKDSLVYSRKISDDYINSLVDKNFISSEYINIPACNSNCKYIFDLNFILNNYYFSNTYLINHEFNDDRNLVNKSELTLDLIYKGNEGSTIECNLIKNINGNYNIQANVSKFSFLKGKEIDKINLLKFDTKSRYSDITIPYLIKQNVSNFKQNFINRYNKIYFKQFENNKIFIPVKNQKIKFYLSSNRICLKYQSYSSILFVINIKNIKGIQRKFNLLKTSCRNIEVKISLITVLNNFAIYSFTLTQINSEKRFLQNPDINSTQADKNIYLYTERNAYMDYNDVKVDYFIKVFIDDEILNNFNFEKKFMEEDLESMENARLDFKINIIIENVKMRIYNYDNPSLDKAFILDNTLYPTQLHNTICISNLNYISKFFFFSTNLLKSNNVYGCIESLGKSGDFNSVHTPNYENKNIYNADQYNMILHIKTDFRDLSFNDISNKTNENLDVKLSLFETKLFLFPNLFNTKQIIITKKFFNGTTKNDYYNIIPKFFNIDISNIEKVIFRVEGLYIKTVISKIN
jgi:hypothetical protein